MAQHTQGTWTAHERLIAAAPDLLDALKEAREVVQDALDTVGAQIGHNEDPYQDGGYSMLERSDYLSRKLQTIDAAIAKAEGGA